MNRTRPDKYFPIHIADHRVRIIENLMHNTHMKILKAAAKNNPSTPLPFLSTYSREKKKLEMRRALEKKLRLADIPQWQRILHSHNCRLGMRFTDSYLRILNDKTDYRTWGSKDNDNTGIS